MRNGLLALTLLLAGCVSGPELRTRSEPGVDLTSYATFGFFEELATDRHGYETFVTRDLKAAVRRELERRGYEYVQVRPQLLVNFHTRLRVEHRVYDVPHPHVYMHYRRGGYVTWVGHVRDRDVRTVREGTLSVDLVDRDRQRLIWEGVASGMVTDRIEADPGPAIQLAVERIFEGFPGRPPITSEPAT